MAGALVVVSYIPYIRSIMQGETKPERATRAIWSVVAIVTLFSYVASGARETAWVALVYAIFQVVIFFLLLYRTICTAVALEAVLVVRR